MLLLMLVVPASGHAASLRVVGANSGDDADSESLGSQWYEGDAITYGVGLRNDSLAAMQDIELRATYDSSQMEFDEAGTIDSWPIDLPECTVDDATPTATVLTCAFAGELSAGGSEVRLPFRLLPGDHDADGTSASITFGASSTTETSSTFDDTTTIRELASPTCSASPANTVGDDYRIEESTVMSQTGPGNGRYIDLPCQVGGNRGLYTRVVSGDAAHLEVTMSLEYTDVMWETPIPVAAPGDLTYVVEMESAEGESVRIAIVIRVAAEADVVVTSPSGPARLAVPPEGGTATYSFVLGNTGAYASPDAIVDVWGSRNGQLLGITVDGVAPPCVSAIDVEDDVVQRCSIGGIAPGALRTVSVTFRITVDDGVRDWDDLDESAEWNAFFVDVRAYDTGTSPYLREADPYDQRGWISTRLDRAASVAPPPPSTCASGEIGTPPNCIAPVTIVGTAAHRTYAGTAAADTFRGGIGNETFRAGGGNDFARGNRGNDRLHGGAGADDLDGGPGADMVAGDAGNDRLRGGLANDVVSGGAGTDDSRGGAGNDRVTCGSGMKDKAFGDAGADVLMCLDRGAGDVIDGGPGIDVCTGDRKDVFRSCERIVKR